MSGTDYTTTPNLGLYKPIYDHDAEQWGNHLNSNADTLDNAVLPTSGGIMTGPLRWTATGGNTLRAAQDRASDYVNVLDYGADPTNTNDSTAAFNAAVATGKSVYIPSGGYNITGAITINAGQLIYGAGPGVTAININSSTFNMSAAGVFVFASGTAEHHTELRDLWIRFQQPSFSGMTRANIVQYPPGVQASASTRIQLFNIEISNAWIAIDCSGGGGAGFFDRLMISAYNVGMQIGTTNAIQDGMHIDNFHFWTFDTTSFQQAVLWDGTTIAAHLGRIDGLMATNWETFRGMINIDATAGTAGYYLFDNMLLNGQNSSLNISNAFYCQINNANWATGAPDTTPSISISGGRVQLSNSALQSSQTGGTTMIAVTGGSLALSNVLAFVENAALNFAIVSAGSLMVYSSNLASHTLAHTAPLIHQSGTGILLVGYLDCAGMTGTAIQADTLTTGSLIGAVSLGGMTMTLPSAMPYVLEAADGASVFVGASNLATSAALYLDTVAGNYRQIIWRTDTRTRWAFQCDNGGEGGSNAGSNIHFVRFSDTATNLGDVFAVNRATGIMNIASLAVGAATGPTILSGTGAATGTQPKGSIFMRTDGAAGSTLYVSQGGGTWNAIAGV